MAGVYGVAAVGYLVHLATAGPYTVVKGMVLDPVVYLRGGRRLPIPPPWDHLDGFLQKSGAIEELSHSDFRFVKTKKIALLTEGGRKAPQEPGRNLRR